MNHFTPGERDICTHCIGGWADPRAGSDDKEKWTFLTLPGLELRPPRSSIPKTVPIPTTLSRLEESGHGLILRHYPNWGKPQQPWLKILCTSAEIRTLCLPVTRPERRRLSQLRQWQGTGWCFLEPECQVPRFCERTVRMDTEATSSPLFLRNVTYERRTKETKMVGGKYG
jgi:hypothetical protein